jgi:pyruvate formate lyase activating enzyme
MFETTTLQQILAENTKEGVLWSKLPDDWVLCFACGHRCKIAPGKDGICKVRFNRDGKLRVPTGYVSGFHLDPIEKKPFFHVLPGTLAMSFGMLGCDYHCSYCQNWLSSQTLRDLSAHALPEFITAEEIVQAAVKYKAPILTSTYNEPLITSEWAVEIFREGKKHGLRGSYVTNGNGTLEVVDYLSPWVDLFKVDLKSYQDKNYRKLGGRLNVVLDTIKMLRDKRFWVEVVTLVVPGFNDSGAELRDIANFIVSVSHDIPWHVTAFHKDYKMTDPDDTPPETLVRAVEIGQNSGLRYVYAGNLPGYTAKYENTYCHSCGTLLIERFGFRIVQNKMKAGLCPRCNTTVPGVWK